MKTLLLPLSLLIVLAVSLTSCVPLDDPAFLGTGGGGFDTGGGYTRRVYTDYGSTTHRYYDDDDYSYSAPRSSYYGSRYGSGYAPGGYYGGSGGYIGSGYTYGSSRLCNVCRRNPCCCRSASYSHHDDDDHRHSSSSSRRSSSSSRSRSDDDEKKYRYSGSVGRGDTKPEGNHSREWYKERGYSLKNLKPAR